MITVSTITHENGNIGIIVSDPDRGIYPFTLAVLLSDCSVSLGDYAIPRLTPGSVASVEDLIQSRNGGKV